MSKWDTRNMDGVGLPEKLRFVDCSISRTWVDAREVDCVRGGRARGEAPGLVARPQRENLGQATLDLRVQQNDLRT